MNRPLDTFVLTTNRTNNQSHPLHIINNEMPFDRPLGNSTDYHFVRGVNIGGWLVLERYITPYQFAVTDCHVAGDLCWYPGQAALAQDSSLPVCDLYHCRPHRVENDFGDTDYPLDEYTLAQAFSNPAFAERWLNAHFEHFITEADIQAIAASGLTHVRVPLPHWILGNLAADEPYLAADRWPYFLRFLQWCEDSGLEVWPDIHTAPGSQNGFDNSGHAKTVISCQPWSNNPIHVQRSLDVLEQVTSAIAEAGYAHVVTGFGLLNEPFKDCDRQVYRDFVTQGRALVRHNLGPHTSIYVSDLFSAPDFEDWWWTRGGGKEDANTFLDSHYYHVFAEPPRALSPRQHIAFTCANEYRDVVSCCGGDKKAKHASNSNVNTRLVSEWSAAYDTLPIARLNQIMEGIAVNGTAPFFDRQMSPERQAFLKHFTQAQMVTYEAAVDGISGGWFYWTAKMEGGAFGEWDYLRGIKEGWMVPVQDPQVPSQQVYGSCYDILFRTNDTMDVVHEFPDPDTLTGWQGPPADDDLVVTHGESLWNPQNPNVEPGNNSGFFSNTRDMMRAGLYMVGVLGLVAVVRHVLKRRHRKYQDYTAVGNHIEQASISL